MSRSGDVWLATMNDQTLNLWRQIESCRFCGKKRQWPSISKRPVKAVAAAND